MSDLRHLLPALLFSVGIGLRPSAPAIGIRCLLAAIAAGVAFLSCARVTAPTRTRRFARASAVMLALVLAGGLGRSHVSAWPIRSGMPLAQCAVPSRAGG